jgi:hypothetical protein
MNYQWTSFFQGSGSPLRGKTKSYFFIQILVGEQEKKRILFITILLNPIVVFYYNRFTLKYTFFVLIFKN